MRPRPKTRFARPKSRFAPGVSRGTANIDRNTAEHPGVGIDPIDVPCLMLTAELDPALRPRFTEGMETRCRNLEIHMIENAGHWVQQEQSDVFNGLLVDWLQRHFAAHDLA